MLNETFLGYTALFKLAARFPQYLITMPHFFYRFLNRIAENVPDKRFSLPSILNLWRCFFHSPGSILITLSGPKRR